MSTIAQRWVYPKSSPPQADPRNRHTLPHSSPIHLCPTCRNLPGKYANNLCTTARLPSAKPPTRAVPTARGALTTTRSQRLSTRLPTPPTPLFTRSLPSQTPIRPRLCTCRHPPVLQQQGSLCCSLYLPPEQPHAGRMAGSGGVKLGLVMRHCQAQVIAALMVPVLAEPLALRSSPARRSSICRRPRRRCRSPLLRCCR